MTIDSAESSRGPGNPIRGELLSRGCFTLAALLVVHLGTFIPIPTLHPEAGFHWLSGQLAGFRSEDPIGVVYLYQWTSIFGLGLAPYFLALIIEHLAKLIAPGRFGSGLEANGKVIKLLTLGLAVLMSLVYQPQLMLGVTPDVPFKITTVASLTGGAMLLMWLAEEITRRGIGHGPSLIVASSIVAALPSATNSLLELRRVGATSFEATVIMFSILLAIVVAVTVFESARRRLLIVHPPNVDHRPAAIELRLNETQVLPPYFAMSALFLIDVVAKIALSDGARSPELFERLALALDPSGVPGFLMQAFLIVLVIFGFRHARISPRQVANDLAAAGAFIPGIRAGEKTALVIASAQNRLAVVGAGYLIAVCLAPGLLAPISRFGYFQVIVGLVIVTIPIVDVIDQVRAAVRSR